MVIIIIVSALMVVKRNDLWLPAFIAIWQMVSLFIDYRKLKSR